MNKKTAMMRWTSGIAAVAVTSGAVLFSVVVANAAVPAGTLGGLTFTPPMGTDLTAPVARTSAACPTSADSANVLIVGPVGAADPIFPADNPYPVVTTTKASFSTTDPFDLPFRVNLKDAANDRGKTLQAGEYDVTARCVKGLTQEVLGTFTGAVNFTSPTAYQTTDEVPVPTGTTVTTPATTGSSAPTTTSAPSDSPTSEGGVPTSTTTGSSTPTTTSAPSDSATSTTATNGGDFVGAGPSSTSGDGSQLPAATGSLAQTGSPVGLVFLVGLFLLAAGLALVLALQRPKKGQHEQDATTDQSPPPTAGF